MKNLSAFSVLLALLQGCASNDELFAEYDVECEKPEIITVEKVVQIPGMPSVIWHPAVYFGFDLDTLADSETSRLNRNLETLKSHPELMIYVQGFTDFKGSNSYNFDLGRRRVNAVVTFLESLGLDAARIISSSLGEALPILAGKSESDRAVNRRVELMLLDASGVPLIYRLDLASELE